MVQDVRGGATTLTLGSKFGMDMKMGPLPYRISNTVVEFEQDRLIAWDHFGKHRWRYELEPLGDGSTTRVTESFDWSTATIPKLIELAGASTRAGRLSAPDASASAHSKLCGSTVSIDLKMANGKVSDYAQTVKACLLGQAAAAVMAREIVGSRPEELRRVAKE